MSSMICIFFFFNDTATTEIYTLSLHDALPIAADLLRDRAFIDARLSQRHVLVNANRLPFGQRNFLAVRQQNVLDIDYTLFHHHECGVAIILHVDMEGGAAYRNDSGWGADAIGVRPAAKLLDVNFDVAQKN